jgi:hypothetical protein
VAEQHLNRANVVAVPEQMRSERVAVGIVILLLFRRVFESNTVTTRSPVKNLRSFVGMQPTV